MIISGQTNFEIQKFSNLDNKDTIYLNPINQKDNLSFLVIDNLPGWDTSIESNYNLGKVKNIMSNNLNNKTSNGLIYYFDDYFKKVDPNYVCIVNSIVKINSKISINLKRGEPPWIFIIPNLNDQNENYLQEMELHPNESFEDDISKKMYNVYNTANYEILFNLIEDKNLSVKANNLTFNYFVFNKYASIQQFMDNNNFDNIVFWVVDNVSSTNNGFLSNNNLKKLYDLSISGDIPSTWKGYIYYYNEFISVLDKEHDTVQKGLITFNNNSYIDYYNETPPWIFLCQKEEKITSSILLNILEQRIYLKDDKKSIIEKIKTKEGDIIVFKVNYDFFFKLAEEKKPILPLKNLFKKDK